MSFLKEDTDLGRAGCKILLAALQAREIASRNPPNARLHAMAVKRFFKLIKRKFGIIDNRDKQVIIPGPRSGRIGHIVSTGSDGCPDETIGVAAVPTMQSGNCFNGPKLISRKMNVKSESFQ